VFVSDNKTTMASNLLEIVLHSLETCIRGLRSPERHTDSSFLRPRFTEQELLFDASKLERMSRQQAVEILQMLSPTSQVKRLLQGPLEEGRQLANIVINKQRFIEDEVDLLTWYLVQEGASLTAFALQNCSTLTAEEVVQIAYGLKSCVNLRTINVDGNRNLRDIGIAALIRSIEPLRSVITFKASNCRITDSHGFVGKNLIGDNRVLTKLDLSKNRLGQTACSIIGPALAENFTLVELNLFGNKIGDGGLLFICNALRQNIVLTELNVGENKLSKAAGEAIGEMLAHNSVLKVLDLHRNRLRNKGVIALCSGLRSNDTLRSLRLNLCSIGNGGALALSAAFSAEKLCLEKLYLQDNLISDYGMRPFCSALKKNKTLRILKLSRNKLEDDARFGEMLAENTALEELVLEGNSISDKGAVEFGEFGLRNNSTLVRVNLARCAIGDVGAEKIGLILARQFNTTLRKIHLNENPISSKVLEDGWMKKARTLRENLEVEMSGINIARDIRKFFGVKIANSETVTNFSVVLLVIAVIANWFDVATDVLVVLEFLDAAQNGDLSYAWSAFALVFLIVPTLYIMIFMSNPEGKRKSSSLKEKLKTQVLTLFQLRIAKEAIESYRARETTTRFGSIRIVEVAGESGPQVLLQISFIIHSLGQEYGDEILASPTVFVSVVLSLFVLGQTFSDLFEKEYILRSTSIDYEGAKLFYALLPCWAFHICQFAFRSITVALLTTLFNPVLAASALVFAILFRFFIKWITNSERAYAFAFLSVFIAQSAWDKRASVIMGVAVSTIESGAVLTALWFTPDEVITSENEDDFLWVWAQGVNFDSLRREFNTILVCTLFGIYVIIFGSYIFRLHSYVDLDHGPGKTEDLDQSKQYGNVMKDIVGARLSKAFDQGEVDTELTSVP